MNESSKFGAFRDGRCIAITALVGSRNYLIHDETSDYDFKIFVYPTFNDLYNNMRASYSFHFADVEGNVHDVRMIPDQLRKSNPNFIEVFFSNDWTAGPTQKQVWEELFVIREELARSNLPYYYDSTIGIIKSKLKTILHPTASTQHLVDKYGYNTKEGMHAIRYADLLIDYARNIFTDYESCIRPDLSHQSLYRNIRHGLYSLERMQEEIETSMHMCEYYKDAYKDSVCDTVLIESIDNRIKAAIEANVIQMELMTRLNVV